MASGAYDTVSVLNPDAGTYGDVQYDTRNSRLDDVAGSFEDRLKLTSALALIGGVRLEDLTLARYGINADGTFRTGNRSPRPGCRCPIAPPIPTSRSKT